MPKPKKRIMRALKINEISGVDVPAQEGALMVIAKRNGMSEDDEKKRKKDKNPYVGKAAAITTSDNGHTHLIALHGPPDGVELNSGFTDYSNDHVHPWIRTESGDIILGEATGRDGIAHTHTIAAMSKADKDKYTVDHLVRSGAAMPDGTFGIVTPVDFNAALKALDGAADKTAAAQHIKSRAEVLGMLDKLPTEGAISDLFKTASGDPAAKTKEDIMSKDDKTAGNTPTVEELQAQLAKSNKIAELTDAQKAHYNTLDDSGKDEFLAKSADERQTVLDDITKRALDADPVVYKTKDGIELRKSAGDAMIALAKSNDNLRAQNDELAKQAESAAIEKRVNDEIPNLPGTVEERGAMLKAIDAMTDESARDASMKALKASNDAMSPAFKNFGHGGSSGGGTGNPSNDGEQTLEELAKVHQAKNTDLSYEQAYAAVIKTAEGRAAYNKSLN